MGNSHISKYANYWNGNDGMESASTAPDPPGYGDIPIDEELTQWPFEEDPQLIYCVGCDPLW